MNRKTVTQIILTLFMVLSMSFSVWAEIKAGDILSYSVDGNEITAFVANPEGKKAYELDCQIGTKRPEAIESHLITEDPVSVKTLILMDNSLSVQSKHREKIKEVLQTLVENHAVNEQYTVACFSDKIEYLLTDSSDYEAVKELIGNVTYKDQETYLTDVLYDLLTGQKPNDTVFRRIIIVSDGVDNKAMGYTKEELNEVLKKSPIPIYTLGCSANNNEEQLKNMFALSRNSKGEGFLIDDLKDVTDFVRSVKQTDSTIRATVTPAAEDMDGTEKGIQMTLSTDGGTAQSAFSVNMPFAEISSTEEKEEPAVKETTPEPTSAADPEPGNTGVTEAVPAEPEPADPGKEGGSSLIGILVLVLGVLLIVFGVVAAIKKKKSASGRKTSGYGDSPTELITDDDSPTELITDDDSPTELITDDDEATSIVDPMLMLVNERNQADVYSAELSKKIIIGRKMECDIVIPEKTVSRQHFEAWLQGNSVMIRNLSDHGTVVNGRPVDVQEIKTGDKILLGNTVFVVEIR